MTNDHTRDKNSRYEYNFYGMLSIKNRDLTAEEVFSSWEIPNLNYDYNIEPKNNEKGTFVIQSMIFV